MSEAADKAQQHALALLRTIPLVDGHNDFPIVVHRSAEAGDLRRFDPARVHEGTDTDIRGCAPGRSRPSSSRPSCRWGWKGPALSRPGRSLSCANSRQDYPDVFTPGRSAADIARAKAAKKIASFITVENGSALENDPGMLARRYQDGVRLLTLCHNGTLDWVDSATDVPRHGGLTALGREIVREMNRLGMVVDCSHVSPKATHDVLDASRAPIVLSHSNAFTLCDHPRNAGDDVLDRVAEGGGVVMATFIPRFTSQALQHWHVRHDPDPGALPPAEREARWRALEQVHGVRPRATLARVCDHIDYMVDRIGIDHVGIGSDFHGGPMVDGLGRRSRFPGLLAALVLRGWADADLAKLAGGNTVRVLSAVEGMRG